MSNHCCGHRHKNDDGTAMNQFESRRLLGRSGSPTSTTITVVENGGGGSSSPRRSSSAYSLNHNGDHHQITRQDKTNQSHFSRLVPFYLTGPETTDDSYLSSKTIQLLLEVETRFGEIREEIAIRISDPNDPFFLYLYLIDYQEYKKIKQRQNLLVPFEKFAPKLIDLFQRCAQQRFSSSSSSECSSPHNGSTFILCLRNVARTTLRLDIVELNEFRNFVHLSFEIPAASDEFIRSHYCSLYRKLKTDTETLQQQIDLLQSQLDAITVAKTKDAQSLRKEFCHQNKVLEEKLAEAEQRLAGERSKWTETERLLKCQQQKLQHELKMREEQLERTRKDYEHQYQEWKEKLNQEVTARHNKLRELQERNQQLETELASLRSQHERTDESATEQRQETETLRKDLAKANEIIRKLQHEVKSSQERVDILSEMTQKQEELVLIRETTVERLSNDLKLVLQQLKTKQSDLERYRENEDRIRTHSSQLELQLAASKKIITNLNKELDRLKVEKTRIEDHWFNGDREHNNKALPKQRTTSLPPPAATVTAKIKRSGTTDFREEEPPLPENHEQQHQNGNNHHQPQPIRNTVLFSNAAELPLKSVNVRTTTIRNTGNVLSNVKPSSAAARRT